ncbi:type II toxin-antitoxin system Phd/YefM family antitoxin [Oryzifoliimicrobium ureilyticus]|uniref:type II toxin-antitoxin system Phd/YefM family antitoxin n=1 Tax=Oryzifoliimicrobium ureilyticus TaxID=3113724 RepID=UPI0030763D14
MPTISLKDAKAEFSSIVDKAAAGEFITITRHGRAAAVLVSVSAAEVAQKSLATQRPSLVKFLQAFPDDLDLADEVFARNTKPSREVDL